MIWFSSTGQMNRDLKKPDPHIYIDLIKESQAGEEFFICFTELQNSFFNHRCNKLKNLVRLVKHWYKMCKEKMDSLPPQYALELLTIYAWEHGSQEINFSIARGFQTVLYLIQKYQELMIYWTINYDTQNETIARYLCCQLQKHRPVILDPADPTSDVGGGKKWSWDKLAQEAERWSTASCLQNWDGSWVQPWNVPVSEKTSSRHFCVYVVCMYDTPRKGPHGFRQPSSLHSPPPTPWFQIHCHVKLEGKSLFCGPDLS
uniref:2'-5'-oligoadenylate synthetase 1 domain-containing protein n=1 Tax=Sarcophilus harrisii TaxID=9305 RepID=A0A7N4V7E1_SARHA